MHTYQVRNLVWYRMVERERLQQTIIVGESGKDVTGFCDVVFISEIENRESEERPLLTFGFQGEVYTDRTIHGSLCPHNAALVYATHAYCTYAYVHVRTCVVCVFGNGSWW